MVTGRCARDNKAQQVDTRKKHFYFHSQPSKKPLHLKHHFTAETVPPVIDSIILTLLYGLIEKGLFSKDPITLNIHYLPLNCSVPL